jgi:hypothetical protein
MADVAEGLVPPPALDQKGNTVIWWVPTIADVSAPTAAEIGASGAKRLTYSFTPDGWGFQGAQDTVDDDRLTIPQPLSSLDTNKVSLDLKYVDSDQAGSAAMVLTAGLSGYFVERRKVPNATLIAAAQKVRVIPCSLGIQNPGPLDGNGKFTIVQKTSINGVVGQPVAVV